MSGKTRKSCDRCLGDFDLPLSFTEQLLLKYAEVEKEEFEVKVLQEYMPKQLSDLEIAYKMDRKGFKRKMKVKCFTIGYKAEQIN